MNELIEKLKDNEAHRIFEDMTDREQECLRRHKEIYGVVEFLLCTMKWASATGITLYTTSIYRIKPDYQPETVEDTEYIYVCPNCKRERFEITIDTLTGFLTGVVQIECECGLKTTFDWNKIKKFDLGPCGRN